MYILLILSHFTRRYTAGGIESEVWALDVECEEDNTYTGVWECMPEVTSVSLIANYFLKCYSADQVIGKISFSSFRPRTKQSCPDCASKFLY